jgi:hypothetical protein
MDRKELLSRMTPEDAEYLRRYGHTGASYKPVKITTVAEGLEDIERRLPDLLLGRRNSYHAEGIRVQVAEIRKLLGYSA